MVKYIHCEKCKKVMETTPWIGLVHTYNGVCPSCKEVEQQENQIQQENAEDSVVEDSVVESDEREENKSLEEVQETTQSSPLVIEKNLLSGLERRVTEILSGIGSMDVLIKEIKIELIDKAKERIDETIQNFDVKKIDAQKVIDYVDKTFEYLSEYKEYMDDVVKKLQANPKMNIKTAIEKVYKEALGNLPKKVAKEVLVNQKALLKKVHGKAEKWYGIHSHTDDVLELTRKMVLHPFTEIQKKLSTLPFYN